MAGKRVLYNFNFLESTEAYFCPRNGLSWRMRHAHQTRGRPAQRPAPSSANARRAGVAEGDVLLSRLTEPQPVCLTSCQQTRVTPSSVPLLSEAANLPCFLSGTRARDFAHLAEFCPWSPQEGKPGPSHATWPEAKSPTHALYLAFL